MDTGNGVGCRKPGWTLVLAWAVAVAGFAEDFPSGLQPVGRLGTNLTMTPVNQLLTPAGVQLELSGMRPQAVALSPDGRLLVTAGKTAEIVIVDPQAAVVRQRVALPAASQREASAEVASANILEPDTKGQVSYTGLAFSPDGSRLYLANVDGDIKVFSVSKDGIARGLASFPLPPANAPGREADIPSGIAVSPDGKRLYVCGNLSNRLLELDAANGMLLRSWEVGVAPYDVVLDGMRAFVSNWGGRRPGAGSVTGPAGQGTLVRVDPVRHIANEGSVSILTIGPVETQARDPIQGREIVVGAHASALALSPNRKYLLVASAGADTLSVIATGTGKVVETIRARQNPSDLFGAQPNALTFDKSGGRLFVCNGTQNAVAVIAFKPGRSKLLGLIPVGWFPGAIVHDARSDMLFVANIKGIGSEQGRDNKSGGMGYNSHQYHGSLSLVRVPSKKRLAALTAMSLRNMRYPLLKAAALPPRPGQPPRPVPERVGEPSVFKHVVYVIKENRTYDQVLGDMDKGNGDPSLCVFGERVTPNQHKLAREFVLLDNTYCSGILSADGHQWADTAIVTDYLEKSFAGFPRSYPDGAGDNDVDALAYSTAGFIWDNAIAHGVTFRNYGEFTIAHKAWKDSARKGAPDFLDHWHDFTNRTQSIVLRSEVGIESLRPYTATNTIGWDLGVPDVWRAKQFIAELREFEKEGTYPAFVLLYLPNDHTSGTRPGMPTPEAAVADNDLALGQVVEALSHSRFWREACLFAIEDDPQDGWDHVSGYRTTAYVVSPYCRRGATVSMRYNQTSLLRTIELILGLPPMNQMDATATPMTDCFIETPDDTPFNATANNIPLDRLNPPPRQAADPVLRKDAYASARLPLSEPDRCPDDELNRILWRALKGSHTPYPEWATRSEQDD